jgi:imidazolonepropionase-like amidohydrolase
MKMDWRRVGCLLAIAGSLSPEKASSQQELALTNLRVISPCENRSWGPATVLIRGAHIIAIDSTHKVRVPADAQSRDMAGGYVIPGLIDSHFHIFQGDTSAAAVDGMRAGLGDLLNMGITSVRDMAGDARILRRLAEAERAGAATPRIFFAALLAGPDLFSGDPRSAAASQGMPLGSAPWMRVISDTSNAQVVIHDAKRTGATGIKLYRDLTEETLTRLASEAKRQGLHVWSHARVRPLPVRRVVLTGVETVSHAHHFLDELEAAERVLLREAAQRKSTIRLTSPQLRAVFDTMAKHGVMFDPTLHLYELDESGLLWAAAAVVAVARDAGVKVLAGTDPMPRDGPSQVVSTSSSAFPLVHRELELLVEYGGFTPMQALRAATCDAAEALGMRQTLGSVSVGRLADLVVLGSNPLERISNVRDTRFVLKNGAIVRQ